MIGKTNAISGVSAPVPKIKTVSGSVISISDALALPAESLVVGINAVQSGSGDPSPDNVRPISGWSNANLYARGKNLCDEIFEDGYINSSGGTGVYANAIRSKNFNPCVPGESYYYKITSGISGVNIAWYDVEKNFIQRDSDKANTIITSPSNAWFFKLSIYNYKAVNPTYSNDISINYPATATDYEEYSGSVTSVTWSNAVTNLFPPISDTSFWRAGYLNTSGTGVVNDSNGERVSDYVEVTVGKTYEFTYTMSSQPSAYLWNGWCFYDSNKTFVGSRQTKISQDASEESISITVPSGVTYIRMSFRTYSLVTSLSFKESVGTVYGGTLNVTTGVLTVTHATADLGDLSWNYSSPRFAATVTGKAVGNHNLICSAYATTEATSVVNMNDFEIKGSGSSAEIYIKDSRYTDKTTFASAVTGVQLVYELATPQTVQLSPTTVQMLLGNNTLWADSGDSELQYWARR